MDSSSVGPSSLVFPTVVSGAMRRRWPGTEAFRLPESAGRRAEGQRLTPLYRRHSFLIKNDDEAPMAEFNHLGLISRLNSFMETIVFVIQEAVE